VKKRIHLYLVLLLLGSLLFMGLGLYVFLVTEVPSVAALKDLRSRPPSTIYGINDEAVYLIVPDNKIFVS
jgi:membrane carboxypeptidase/penicillin-binding protein